MYVPYTVERSSTFLKPDKNLRNSSRSVLDMAVDDCPSAAPIWNCAIANLASSIRRRRVTACIRSLLPSGTDCVAATAFCKASGEVRVSKVSPSLSSPLARASCSNCPRLYTRSSGWSSIREENVSTSFMKLSKFLSTPETVVRDLSSTDATSIMSCSVTDRPMKAPTLLL